MTKAQQSKIKKAVEKVAKGESEAVKQYICEIIALTFQSLESPAEKQADFHTTAENLRFALAVNLEDEYFQLLKEAREETAKK